MNRGAESTCLSGTRTGMAGAVMHEIAEHLGRLATAGVETRIDLRSLPLTDADLAELAETLGKGEVEAELNVIGTSSVRETAFPGVWWIRHYGSGGRVAAEEIAITPLPEILKTHADDIRESATRLRRALDGGTQEPNKEASNG